MRFLLIFDGTLVNVDSIRKEVTLYQPLVPQEEVDKMTQQRQVLVARFRQQMNSDDITKNLVGHLGNDHEVFLEDHLRQFKEVAAIIRQNLTAQENILT